MDKNQCLKSNQNANTERKNELNSRKYLMTEFDNLQVEERQKEDLLRDSKEVLQKKYNSLAADKINNLIQFEQDVQEISAKFINAPRDYENDTLMKCITKVSEDLEAKLAECSEYQQTLQHLEQNIKELPDDTADFATTLNVFEENTNDVETLNEKFKGAVQRLTNQINCLHYDIGSFVGSK